MPSQARVPKGEAWASPSMLAAHRHGKPERGHPLDRYQDERPMRMRPLLPFETAIQLGGTVVTEYLTARLDRLEVEEEEAAKAHPPPGEAFVQLRTPRR